MAKKKRTVTGSRGRSVTLVQSEEKSPAVSLKPGMQFDVVAVRLVDAQLGRAKKLAARLCGGSSTCLALIDVDEPRK
jgi:hypothetical protein